jgi:hypothetical protein
MPERNNPEHRIKLAGTPEFQEGLHFVDYIPERKVRSDATSDAQSTDKDANVETYQLTLTYNGLELFIDFLEKNPAIYQNIGEEQRQFLAGLNLKDPAIDEGDLINNSILTLITKAKGEKGKKQILTPIVLNGLPVKEDEDFNKIICLKMIGFLRGVILNQLRSIYKPHKGKRIFRDIDGEVGLGHFSNLSIGDRQRIYDFFLRLSEDELEWSIGALRERPDFKELSDRVVEVLSLTKQRVAIGDSEMRISLCLAAFMKDKSMSDDDIRIVLGKMLGLTTKQIRSILEKQSEDGARDVGRIDKAFFDLSKRLRTLLVDANIISRDASNPTPEPD